jgi:Ca2+-binding RTX toxin-like protein
MSGDTPPIVSNDLLGHSGIITHDVVGAQFDGLTLFGISANVADNDEPGIVVRPSDGANIITEGGVADSYQVVLTRAPTVAEVIVKAFAPLPSEDDRELGQRVFAIFSNASGAVNEPDGTAVSLKFTPSNWYIPQTVMVAANATSYTDAAGVLTRPELGQAASFSFDDTAFEGVQFGVINHVVQANVASVTGLLDGTTVAMLDGARQAVIQIAGTVAVGDTFSAVIGGTTVTATTTAATVANAAAELASAIDGGTYPSLTINAFTVLETTVTMPNNAALFDTVEVTIGTRTFSHTITGGSPTAAALASILADLINDAKVAGLSAVANGPFSGSGKLAILDASADTITTSLTTTAADLVVVISDDADANTDDRTTFAVAAGNSNSGTAAIDIRVDGGNGTTTAVGNASGVTASHIGRRIEITSGPGAGQLRFVIAVGGSVVTVDRPWDTQELATFESGFLVRIDDTDVDGGDTKVFAPGPNTLSQILGPVFVEGGGGEGSLGLPDPVLLAGETNVKPSTGNVVGLSGTQLTVETADLTAILGDLGLANVAELVDKTVEVTKANSDVALGQFRLVTAVQVDGIQTVLTLNAPYAADEATLTISGTVEIGDRFVTVIDGTSIAYTVQGGDSSLADIASGLASAINTRGLSGVIATASSDLVLVRADLGTDFAVSVVDGGTMDAAIGLAVVRARALTDTEDDAILEYAITSESLNFFVDEREAIDVMFVHDQDSPADSTGTLTANRLFGLNMGPDLVIGGALRPGGVTYENLEAVEIDLGYGNNTFDVLGTHTRQTNGGNSFTDNYQTWTLIKTGDDTLFKGVQGDTVNVKLNQADVTTRTGDVVAAANPSAMNNFSTTVTVDGTPFADGELAGQLIQILDSGTGNVLQTAQIVDNTGNVLTVEDAWAALPTSSEDYRIINPADGNLAVNTQGGDDTVDASMSTFGLVIFGGDGNDSITGGSGGDIIFGDRGRVDYFGEDADGDGTRPIVTRLGTAPDPITGKVTGHFDPDTVIEDSNASFPVPDGVDIGLQGLFVDINDGTGFLEPPKLITGNTGTTLTVAAAFTETLGATSAYRVSTFPEDQTDGVIRGANLILTVDVNVGGNDVIVAGGGADQVFGGTGNDAIEGGTGDDLLVGDAGRLDRDRVATEGTVFVRGADAPVIDSFYTRLRTTSVDVGGTDTIGGDAGSDIILGGGAGDVIYGNNAADTTSADDGADILLGDFGEVNFQLGVVANLKTTDSAHGASDTIQGHADNDIILGGANSSSDTLTGDAGNDILIGDFGQVRFDLDTPVDLTTVDRIETLDDAIGGADSIAGNAGDDLAFGGAGGDTIDAGADDNIVLGDSGFVDYVIDDGNDPTDIDRISSPSPTVGGADIIDTGDGDDFIIGGRLGADIEARDGDNIVIGDSGRILSAVSDAVQQFAGQPMTVGRIETIEDTDGAADTISTLTGYDIVLGGQGGDTIGAGNGHNIVLGDNGFIDYDDDSDPADIDRISTTDPNEGGSDSITTGAGNDFILGGTAGDEIRAGAGNDLVFGDHGKIEATVGGGVDASQLPLETLTPAFTFTAIDTQNANGGDDLIHGEAGKDIILGQQGGDTAMAVPPTTTSSAVTMWPVAMMATTAWTVAPKTTSSLATTPP